MRAGPMYVRNDNEYLTRIREPERVQFRLTPPYRPVAPAKDGIYRTWRGPTVWVDRSIATGQVVARSDDP